MRAPKKAGCLLEQARVACEKAAPTVSRADHIRPRSVPPHAREANMKRRFRCRIGLHKWLIRQDAPDTGRYYGCAYCDRMQDSEGTPIHVGPAAG